jgi:hypothetical protein
MMKEIGLRHYTNILNQEELLYKTMEVIHGRDRTDGTQIYEVSV